MACRIFSLLLCVLLAGPLNVPAWAIARPETRVGEIFPPPLKSAADFAAQPVGSHQAIPACRYDFASGVHKYLYGHNDPVNRVDPSGHMDIGTTLTTAGIGATIGGLSTLVANHALGRAQTTSSILMGAGLGAVLGPLAVEYAWFGVAVGGVGVASSGAMVWEVFSNPNSTYVQKVEASALLVASVWGTSIGVKYARAARTQAAAQASAAPMTKRLFRVVSRNEQTQLLKTGEFEFPPNGSTPDGLPWKWFYGTRADAEAFAQAHANENPRLIATEVTETAIKQVFPNIDGGKTGYFIHLEDLAGTEINWLPWP